jgi:hypothetical protein
LKKPSQNSIHRLSPTIDQLRHHRQGWRSEADATIPPACRASPKTYPSLFPPHALQARRIFTWRSARVMIRIHNGPTKKDRTAS